MPKLRKKKIISNVRNAVLVLAILVLLMGGIYYYFFRALEKTGERISFLKNETDTLLAEEANLNSLRAIFSQTSEERQKLDSYFVQSNGVVDFITSIEHLAAFANLDYETTRVDTEEKNPPSNLHEFLHLTFRTTGSWQNTYLFTSLLESLPYNVIIHRIDLTATGNSTIEAVNTPTLELSTSTPTITRRGSVWEATYDFSVIKMK